MVPVRWVVSPVGVGVMRRQQPDPAAGSGDAVKLADKRDHIRHMLDDVIRDNQLKLIIRKRIRQFPEIVNDVGTGPWIVVQPHSTLRFIYSTSDIEDLHRG